MTDLTLLVLADPTDPTLGMLERLPDSTAIVCGDSVEAVQSSAAEADIILNWSGGNRELLERVCAIAPRVRWVHSRSAGLDDVLFPALADSPTTLTNGRGVFSRPLAEFAMAAILYFAKDLRRMVHSQEKGIWDPFDIEEVHGKVMGIIGYGDIGRTCAAYASTFGMRILALRKRPEMSQDDPYAEKVYAVEQRNELMAGSDYAVLSLPLTAETQGLIGEPGLRSMKKTAVLINLARGPVVDESILVRALRENWIRGAALDVFDREPLPDGHPFYQLQNVLLSPHCADHTADWLERAMEMFLENFERFRKREPLRNVVDKKAAY